MRRGTAGSVAHAGRRGWLRRPEPTGACLVVGMLGASAAGGAGVGLARTFVTDLGAGDPATAWCWHGLHGAGKRRIVQPRLVPASMRHAAVRPGHLRCGAGPRAARADPEPGHRRLRHARDRGVRRRGLGDRLHAAGARGARRAARPDLRVRPDHGAGRARADPGRGPAAGGNVRTQRDRGHRRDVADLQRCRLRVPARRAARGRSRRRLLPAHGRPPRNPADRRPGGRLPRRAGRAARQRSAARLLHRPRGRRGRGKSTQARALAAWLESLGHDVLVTFEPGATEVGRRLRSVLLDHPRPVPGYDVPPPPALSARTEALLFAADRPSTSPRSSGRRWPWATSSSATATPTRRWPTRAPAATGRCRGRPAVPVGDRRPPAAPHRAARPARGRRAGPGGGAGPVGVRAAGVPRAGPRPLPRAGPPRRCPLPRGRRHPAGIPWSRPRSWPGSSRCCRRAPSSCGSGARAGGRGAAPARRREARRLEEAQARAAAEEQARKEAAEAEVRLAQAAAEAAALAEQRRVQEEAAAAGARLAAISAAEAARPARSTPRCARCTPRSVGSRRRSTGRPGGRRTRHRAATGRRRPGRRRPRHSVAEPHRRAVRHRRRGDDETSTIQMPRADHRRDDR